MAKKTVKKFSTFKKRKPLERRVADSLVKTHERNEKLKDKISDDDRTELTATIKQTQEWMETHSDATTEEFETITDELYYVGTKFLFAWPNPSNEYMFIAGNGLTTIYDMMGRRVYNIRKDEILIYLYDDGSTKKILTH